MHHDSDWNYVNRADQNRVPNLSRARFDYKRKDEDDMAKSTKTYEERIRALEKKEQESIEATKKLIAQRKELEKRKKAEESKKRTHRLCQIGGAVESVLGCPIEEEDLPKLIGFLKRRLPKKPPKVLSDRSHDIPTRKRIIPCASPDMQPGTVVYRKKRG